MSTANVTQYLLDHVAITNLLNRYTDAGNRRDWAALEATFAEDAVWDAAGSEPEHRFYYSGRTALLDGIRKLVEPMELMVQTNHAIAIEVDGNTAKATSTMEERFRFAAGGPAFHILGTYYDELVKGEDGEWRFRVRRFRPTYSEPLPSGGQIIARFPLPEPMFRPS